MIRVLFGLAAAICGSFAIHMGTGWWSYLLLAATLVLANMEGRMEARRK